MKCCSRCHSSEYAKSRWTCQWRSLHVSELFILLLRLSLFTPRVRRAGFPTPPLFPPCSRLSTFYTLTCQWRSANAPSSASRIVTTTTITTTTTTTTIGKVELNEESKTEYAGGQGPLAGVDGRERERSRASFKLLHRRSTLDAARCTHWHRMGILGLAGLASELCKKNLVWSTPLRFRKPHLRLRLHLRMPVHLRGRRRRRRRRRRSRPR